MSSKKYKGKSCIYCSKSLANIGDHVFAREFFLLSHRANLPQVPACDHCNNEKSKLEHYLATVLPFGGLHHDSKENLELMVPKRLAKNKRLQKELQLIKLNNIYTKEKSTGLLLSPSAVSFDGEKLVELMKYIVKGLLWHHMSIILPNDYTVEVHCLTSAGIKSFYENFFTLRTSSRVHNNLGNGTFEYIGIQAVDTPEISIWLLSTYGSMQLSSDLYEYNKKIEISRIIGAITRPSSMPNIITY